MTRKLLFFLYSTPHIVGSLGGLLGLALYFSGIINSYWYFIVLGLYAAGVLGWPSSREYRLRLNGEVGVKEIRTALDRLAKSLRGEVSKPIVGKVENIVASIQSVLPRIMELDQTDRAAYTIRETALTYLPETLENYLRLPKIYRRFHKLQDGRTPQTLLLEQLEILERQMAEVVDDVHKDDLNGLEAHGRFLRSRFAQSDSFIN